MAREREAPFLKRSETLQAIQEIASAEKLVVYCGESL